MGYTHYWTQTRDFNEVEMRDICSAIRRIIKTAQKREVPCYGGINSEDTVVPTICGFDGTGAPTLNKDEISFNGQGPDFDHETFYFKAKRETPYPGGTLGGAFCKTARKPYDVVVTACLTFLQADYGFEVSSDGVMEDWDAGVRLAEEALGRAFANPMIVEELVR